MSAPLWDRTALGCIERDTTRLHGTDRTALSSTGNLIPLRSKRADIRAPIAMAVQMTQTRAQWQSFTQWHRFDLAGGALPFYLDLWLWDRTRRVRARFVGAWQAQCQDLAGTYRTQAVLELERESL